MSKQELCAEAISKFDYATYNLKKIIETIEQINEVLLKVDPSLVNKGISPKKRKPMLPSITTQTIE